jgi:hypothetical protein
MFSVFQSEVVGVFEWVQYSLMMRTNDICGMPVGFER